MSSTDETGIGGKYPYWTLFLCIYVYIFVCLYSSVLLLISVDHDLLDATNNLLAHVGLVDFSSKSSNKVLSIKELQTVSSLK